MKVFISHAHEERRLAEAWKTLLMQITGFTIDVWYSSDRDPSGGIGYGRWRERIGHRLEEAEAILAIFTPESASRPWIFFETAFAMGLSTKKLVIPIVYYMSKEYLPSPLQDQQSYRGDEQDEVFDLCKRLHSIHIERTISQTWI